MKIKQDLAPVFTSAILPLARVTALALAFLACPEAKAAGTWTALANKPPGEVNTMLLLPDGTVMAADADNWTSWYRLTPDIHGSYLNGTWTTLAAMHDSRLYYASDVLTNGRVFAAGGEYGSGASSGEIYDPLLNTWTMISPGAGQSFVDMISVVLPNSTVLAAPVYPSKSGQTAVYDPETDSWPLFPMLVRGRDQAEASWVMLPDNSILTDDPFSTNTERYIPSLSRWIDDTPLPVQLYDTNLNEIGAFFLLANSNAFCLGNAGYTALYTPSGSTNAGSWVAGPNEPPGLGVPDGPGAMMTDGDVLCTMGYATNYDAPTFFYEYDPVANVFNGVSGPGSFTNDIPPYVGRMLDLPDGTVLYSSSSRQLYEYQPAGASLAAGQPAITSVTTNFYRSYHLTGTLLNGISQGAAYGDDAQMNSNYPLIRMTNNATGNVYYARAYNWSSTVVMTGSLPVTTDFIVPQNLPAGAYSLVAVANGNSSAPVPFAFSPDNLQMSSLNGFGASGPAGGPVAAQSMSYNLTNAGGSSLNWFVGNLPVWLNVSTNNGTLPAGGTSAVTISLNTAIAAAQPVGNYAATVWFTNLSSGAIQSAPFSYQSTPLIVNGGFESGSFAFWSLSDDTGFSMVGNNGATDGQTNYVHSGFYGAELGSNSAMSYLSQTIPTVAGERYALSFWLNNTLPLDTNQITVTWDGTNLLNETDLGAFPFTNFQFNVVGAPGETVLDFGFLNDTNYFALDDVTLTALVGPTMIVSPTNQTVLETNTILFTALALGTPPLYYQWQFNNTNLPNATNTALILTNVATNQSGFYTITVSNAYGTTSSPPALLTVLLQPGPLITVPPASQTVAVGGTAAFAVQAQGVPPLFYQWQLNGTNIAKATNSVLTLTNVAASQGGFYTVVVTDVFGSTSSLPAILTVVPPSIVQNGGFETGDFSDWTLSGNTNYTEVVADYPYYTHSGEFGAQAGPFGSPEFISQTLVTIPGQDYLFSCWVNNPEGATPNEFLVTWNGSNLLSEVNLSDTTWTNLQATVLATQTNSVLTFIIQDNPGYLGLDDISVNPIPQPSFLAATANSGAFVFQWSTLAGFSYQVQYTGDLQSGYWTNLGGPVIADSSVTIETDSLTNSARFYRVLLAP